MKRIYKISENEYMLRVSADPTVNISISSGENDGDVYGSSDSYADAHENADGYSDTGYLHIGQVYLLGYEIYRTFLKFNTASIPSDATITSASLYLYGYEDHSTNDFIIRLQKWTGDVLIDTGDYNQFDGINYDDGTFNTSSFVTDGWNKIVISNFDLINKEGYTKICVRGSGDVSRTPPTDYEYVIVYSYDNDTSYAPYLQITYTTAAPPPKHPTTHLDKGPHPRSRMTFYPRLSL